MKLVAGSLSITEADWETWAKENLSQEDLSKTKEYDGEALTYTLEELKALLPEGSIVTLEREASRTDAGTTEVSFTVTNKNFEGELTRNVILVVSKRIVNYSFDDLVTTYQKLVSAEDKVALYTNEKLEMAGILAKDMESFNFAIEIANEKDLVSVIGTHADQVVLTFVENPNYVFTAETSDYIVEVSEDILGEVTNPDEDMDGDGNLDVEATGANRTHSYNATAFEANETMFKVVADGVDRTADATFLYSLDGGLTFTSEKPSMIHVGVLSFDVKVSLYGYVDAYIENVTLRVTPATAILTVENTTKVEGQEDIAFKASVAGLFANDTLDYVLSREVGESVGAYAITAKLTNNPNYVVEVINGVLEITAAPPAITPEEPSEPTEPSPTEPSPTTPSIETPEVNEEVEEVTEELDSSVSEEEMEESSQVEVESEEEEGTSSSEESILTDNITPLGALRGGSWSLFDLIMTLISVVLPIVFFLSVKRKRDEEQDEEETETKERNQRASSAILVIAGMISVILLLLTQDFTKLMTIFDVYSIVFALIVIVQIVLMILKGKKQEEVESEV